TASYIGSSKVYDRTTSATVTGSSADLIAGDTVSFSQSAAFADKNAGSAKTINVTGIALGGNDAANYALQNTTATTSADIAAKALTASYIGSSKVYDRTTSATVTGSSADLIAGDTVSFSQSAAFADKNAGSAKTINVTGIALAGTDATNYALQNTTATTSADITAKALTATYSGSSKVYDRTTAATVTGSSTDLIAGDTVSFSQSAAFADKNAGTAKTINVAGIALGGSDAANYALQNTTATTRADIAARPVSIAANAQSKIYGDADPALTFVAEAASAGRGLLAEDTLSGTLTRMAGETVMAGPYAIDQNTLTNANNPNYDIAYSGNTLTIRQRNLTVTAIGSVSKTYDGSAAAAIGAATFENVVDGDRNDASRLALGGIGTYDSRHVGTDKTVSFAGLTLTGTAAGNYSIAGAPASTAGNGISQLAAVAWSGAGADGNWSNAANWAGGALPDRSNVAAVIIPAGASVTYDGAAGATQLRSLSSQGNLDLAGGSLALGSDIADASHVQNATLRLSGAQLTVAGSLQADILRLGTGTLNGSGDLTSADFAQSGGVLAATLANLRLASVGDFILGTRLGATQSIALTSGGAIRDTLSAGSSAALRAPSVRLDAATGIGTAANPVGMATEALSARTGTGTIHIANTPSAAVTLAAMTTGDASAIAYAQHGMGLNIVGSIASAGGTILIDPPTDLTMSAEARVTSVGGSIKLEATGDITLATVDAGSGAVAIETSGGQIGTATPGTNNVTAASLSLDATSGIQLAYVAPSVRVANTSGTIALLNANTGVTVSLTSTEMAAAVAAQEAALAAAVIQTPVTSFAQTPSSAAAPAAAPEPVAVAAPASAVTASELPSGSTTSVPTSAASGAAGGQTESDSESKTKDKQDDKPAAKPVVQTVTVANTAVQKPADQVVQVDQPRGRALVCR
ncbi:MAG: hypothetical protein HZC24_09105, partial [Rhodocyclales bacterium]|nr:hypothetical protein [Rhodocyclales bacterium]